MTKQAKITAREVQAPKTVEVRKQFKEYADRIQDVQQSLNSILYDAAMFCRKEQATPEELQVLLDVIDRRKRTDFKRIVTAPDEAITKSMPANLVQAAQFIRARVKGAPAATAKSYATGKLDSAGLKAKLGETAPTPTEGEEPARREVERDYPKADEVGNLSRLNDLLPALEAELSEYGPECQKAMKAFKAAAAALMEAAANG